MPDLVNRLAALHDSPAITPSDDTVAADLHRGRRALIARRRRRAGVAGGVTVGLVAVGALTYGRTGSSTPDRPRQAAPRPPALTHDSTTPGAATRSSAGPSSAHGRAPAIALVDYHGSQLPGYTVSKIPQGYVLQGISGSVLDVAVQGDHTSLDSFVGKIVVMLNDHVGQPTGKTVTVNGHPGRLSDQGGTQILTYQQGRHYVEVQAWTNIRITQAQLVQFAEGVTVLPGAEVGSG